jgi:DNA excision repair protein ERCC-2
VLRTPDDRGVLILGDSRFLDTEVKSGLPPWMQEEMTAITADMIPGVLSRWR